MFAFAVTQVTTLLHEDLSWAGAGRSLLALALVWWAWSAFAWATNAHDPTSSTLRAVLLVASVPIFVAGLALPDAFRAEGTLFAVAYALVRLMHLALYADAARRGNASRRSISGFAATVAVGLALLVGGSFASGGARIGIWAAAAAIDYAGPAWLTRERLRGIQRVAVAHFAERYGLFVIICLGESIIAIGLGAGHHPGARTVLVVTLALLATIGLWWTYFDRAAAAAEERLAADAEPVLAAADGYSYLHLVIVAGIIVFATGARDAVAHASAPLPDAARLALCGGVALYLAGHAAFRPRLTGAVCTSELVAAAACVIAFAVTGGGGAWLPAALVTLVLAALVGWEAANGRGARTAVTA